VKAAAASTLIEVQPATWRHLAGWTTTLPLATDSLQMHRTMDTQALAAAFPLASADLPAPLPGDPATTGGVLYGVNPDSQGIVWWDRWAQENHNCVVLARSGAGKSYFVKLDVLRQLYQGVHVAVIDPEDEYVRLADAVGGTIVRLGAPGVKINPLDLPVGDTRPDVLTRRGLFLHTLIAVLLGSSGREPALSAAMKAALDRAIGAVYRGSGITPDPATHHRPAPLLGDLAATLAADTDPAASELAARLAPWVAGTFSDLFNGPTTTRPDGHLVVWSLRHLPDELRTVGTLLALNEIWRQVDLPPQYRRRGAGSRPQRRRLVVVDEAWLLMRDGEGARFLFTMSKAARKRNAGLTVITQDVADVLGTDLGQAVVSNAATQILLKQAPQAIDAVADAFGLTGGERRMLLSARVGHGLLISGTNRTAFESISSPAEHRIATTKPSDLADLDDEEDQM
jgi:type IV secretory pathway VirB4 component